MMHFRFLSTVIIICLALLVLPQNIQAQKFGKIEDSEWATGAPQGYEEASAVVLFSRATMGVTIDEIEIQYHVRMKVLTDAGADEVGDLSISYNKEYDKFKSFEAHTLSPDGSKVKVDKKAIFEKEYGDIVTVTFSFPQVKPGCILEYKYKIISENYWYLRPWYFQNRLYTYQSTFSVELWPGFAYDASYHSIPPGKQKAVVTERPDPTQPMGTRFIKAFTWELDNLPPVNDEPYMSCENDYRISIRFQLISYTFSSGHMQSFVKEWSDIGDTYTKFLDEYCNKTSYLEKLADSLTAGITDPREKSKALFAYVATQFKTSSAPGRWFVNDKMSQMFETGYETREAKNVLLAELHKAVDISAWPVLLSTRDHGKLDPSFASRQQFNTLVTSIKIGDTWEFLDASNIHAPYGILRPQCLADGGLLIDGDKSDLIRITIQPSGSYRTDVTYMHVRADGAVDCRTRSEFGGYYAADFADRYDESTHEEFIEAYYKNRIGGLCTITGSTCEVDETNRFIASVDYSANDLIIRLDENIQVQPINLAFKDCPFSSDKRSFPVDFTYPFIYHNQNEIMFETPAASYVLPENMTEQIDGASFKRQCVTTDSSVIVITQLTIEKPEFPPYKYGLLKDFFDKYVRIANESVTAVVEN